MAQIILSNCKLWAGGYDLSGKLNAIAIDDKPPALDNTTFGCTAKSRKQGLSDITAALAGFWGPDVADIYLSDFTLTDIPMTVAPTPTVGGFAYSFLSRNTEYQFGGAVGEMGKFSVKAESVGQQLIGGWILENGVTARIATGTGTICELIEAPAAKYIYGALHVIAAAAAVGDTLNVTIESDSLVGFGTPSTRLTFNQILGNGGVTYNWETPVIGDASGDTFWRAKWTIAGGTPSFTIAVFLGIL